MQLAGQKPAAMRNWGLIPFESGHGTRYGRERSGFPHRCYERVCTGSTLITVRSDGDAQR